jgi:hypothetical protein
MENHMNSTLIASATKDNGRVCLGAGARLPAPKPAGTADSNAVKIGAGARLPRLRTSV